jgi:hypothetical protein
LKFERLTLDDVNNDDDDAVVVEVEVGGEIEVEVDEGIIAVVVAIVKSEVVDWRVDGFVETEFIVTVTTWSSIFCSKAILSVTASVSECEVEVIIEKWDEMN